MGERCAQNVLQPLQVLLGSELLERGIRLALCLTPALLTADAAVAVFLSLSLSLLSLFVASCLPRRTTKKQKSPAQKRIASSAIGATPSYRSPTPLRLHLCKSHSSAMAQQLTQQQ